MNDHLLEESRQRFYDLAEYLRQELEKLYEEGVFTESDWLKIKTDSNLSAQAVLKAINDADYPPEMQRELVRKLIDQYEESIEQILSDARARRYSSERVNMRIKSIEERVVLNWKNALDARIVSKRQYNNTMALLRAKHKEIVKGIKSIPREHPKRLDLVESWLKEYEMELERLSKIPSPELSYATSKPVSQNGGMPSQETPFSEGREPRKGWLRRLLSSVRRKNHGK